MNPPALSTRGLDKSFGSLVVANKIEINLPQGERYALIGPNGAGKTTLINLMTGMLQPDRRPDHPRLATTSPRASPRSGSSAGWCARSRSIRCFRTSTRSRR